MKYKIVKRGEPGVAGGGTQQYYAAPLYIDEIDLSGMSKRLANGSTLTQTDIVAVVTRVVAMIGEELMQGKIVRMGDLGSFRLSLSSRGETTAEDVTAGSIKSSKVLFRPGKVFTRNLSELTFEKAKDVIVNPDDIPDDDTSTDAAA